ncbi:MAG: efflux RND transporter periplasmic adaptor subunit [Mesorhizobium sp.]|nr:MAG: efflux RND transporter periplasmic adaptor subunit [Mesorhizobium sp.]
MNTFRPIILGLACAALVGCEDHTSSHAAPQPVLAIPASLAQYQPGAEVTGEMKARVQSELSFRTGGRVRERRVDVGSLVRAGEVLMRIDDTEQRADVDSARAGLRSAQATVKQKALAFERYKTLLKSRAIAQSTYDGAREALTTAQGSLEVAQASLETALDALSHTELKADADGVITSRSVEAGQVVSAAQPALTLARDGPRDASFDVFEAFFLPGRPTREVEVAPVGDRARTARGNIREVSPVIDTSTGTIRVKVALPLEAQWSLGTSVVGEFHSPARQGVILPWSAMASARGEPAVWVIDPASKSVSLRKVAVARYRTADFIVTGGIAPKDLIVTDGGKFLKQGQAVAWQEK